MACHIIIMYFLSQITTVCEIQPWSCHFPENQYYFPVSTPYSLHSPSIKKASLGNMYHLEHWRATVKWSSCMRKFRVLGNNDPGGKCNQSSFRSKSCHLRGESSIILQYQLWPQHLEHCSGKAFSRSDRLAF